jgi:hypothetical protein
VYTRVRDLVVIHCSAGQSFLSIFFLFFSRLFLSDAALHVWRQTMREYQIWLDSRHPIGQMGSTGIPSSSFIDVILSETAERYRHSTQTKRAQSQKMNPIFFFFHFYYKVINSTINWGKTHVSIFVFSRWKIKIWFAIIPIDIVQKPYPIW